MSLLPSATEILFAFGAGDQVVGVTFECDHPPEARDRTIVSTSALPPGLEPEASALVASARHRLDAVCRKVTGRAPVPTLVEALAAILHPEVCGPTDPSSVRRMR